MMSVSMSIYECIHLYSVTASPNAPDALVPCEQNVFSRCLKSASVESGMQTEYGRLFHADGPAMAKAWQLYVLSQ